LSHDTPLIATIVVGLCLAFALGFLAHRLRMPPLAGYLLAGVVVGPFTPGYVADQHLATELAELGVILLMFGVGLHFSPGDLMSVRAIAVPGAVGQIALATAAGVGLGVALGWSAGASLIFGLSLSVASTVVLLRALQDRDLVTSDRGRIAVGWLIVEDLAMVIALVLVPPFSEMLGGNPVPVAVSHTVRQWLPGVPPVWLALGLTIFKVAAFVVLMLVVGRRIIPALLHHVANTGSRELFRLAVLAIALGVAFGSARFFDVSFALGAFFAGMVMAGSTLSAQAMKETLPLRDAFAVLFFVSVGMLFDPGILVREPLAVLATVGVIVLVKSVAAYAIVRAFGHDRDTAFTIAASLAQIGEFSFILIVMGVTLGIVPETAQALVVAGALISILVNPVLFALLDRRAARKATEVPPAPEDGDGSAGI
jgi:CPA2 family monovalent cation:H+ antiporter-2